ncbi:cupin domain-containing protein [Emcibacter sp. SYSU 3D8]|uniref:cupin domain-containing protein n=1 Tax=Emcibacter sp. SYSU 3D8 TaxID=3133969 RepID=UPI0031FE453A
MTARPLVVSPADYAAPLDVVGEHITVLASSDATGSYEIFLQQGPEGSGPPPHSHAWDESFFVMQGNVEFGHGDEHLTAGPGTLVHLPAGTTHWFRFAAGGGKMLSISGNGNAARMFAAMDAEIPAGAPDIPKVIAIARRHGLTMGD